MVVLDVAIVGLLHGANPSHGWTVASVCSMHSRRCSLGAVVSSSIIAGAHFLSSIEVVVAHFSITLFIQLTQIHLNYAASFALTILAYIFWREKGEDLIETQHGHLNTLPEKRSTWTHIDMRA